MKLFLTNSRYFLNEVKSVFRAGRLSALSAFISVILMFLLLSLALAGWWTSAHITESVSAEAEINVFYSKTASPQALVTHIQALPGVSSARFVDSEEAYGRMAALLGDEAEVLSFFDENPFSPFIEVLAQTEDLKTVTGSIEAMDGIEYVRDNRDILEKLYSLTAVVRLLGVIVLAAVGISTAVVVSHIIRQGIEEHREQMLTLRLLGAPESFINFPFLLQGLLLTLAGGTTALVVMALVLQGVYARLAGTLPFFPFLPAKIVVIRLAAVLVPLGIILGLGGSLTGLYFSRRK